MKKILFTTLLFSIVFISCNESKKNTIETTVDEQQHEKEEINNKENKINNNWIDDIELDDGLKWIANVETTQGVYAMLSELNKSNPKTVEDYISMANRLNDEKNMVVKECTMKGPSHDNLHIFLLPLIEKIDLLLEITSPEEGMEITASIKENLEAYTNYFK